MLDLLFKIIDVTDVGIPLGFYTSQWLSNWFLQDLDHYIKEQLHRTLKRMIERGQTDGLEDKLDIFFAAGKLTEEEYQELIDMLNLKETE